MDNETVPLEQMTAEQRTSWRLTGVEPTREVKEEIAKESEASTHTVSQTDKPEPKAVEKKAHAEAEEADSGPAAKTSEEQHKPAKKSGQMGYKELRTRIAELEQQIAEGKKPVAADQEAERAEAKAKDEKERPRPRSTDKKADGSAKYTTWEEYEDALLEWRDERTVARLKGESAKEQQNTKVEQLRKEVDELTVRKVEEGRKKYTDFDTIALAKDLPIIAGSFAHRWIMESDLGMDIAYHYGKNRDDLVRLNAMSERAAARELQILEDKLAQGAKETPKDTKVVEAAPPPKITKAPPPAREVGGRGSAATDDEASAVSGGDFSAYRRVVNKKEIAARKT